MNRTPLALTLVTALLWNMNGMAQQPTTHQHLAPQLIKGEEHPEQIPDEHAWLLQLIASTSADKDKPETKKHAQVHRTNLGLTNSDSTLTAFRQSYEHLIADEVNSLAQQQFNHDLYVLIVSTVDRLETDYAAEKWEQVTKRVEDSKKWIAITDEKPSPMALNANEPFQLASLTINDTGSIYGYDVYTALDTNGTTDYVTTYVIGSTNVSWSCNYVYTGPVGGWKWEPAGCPAQHSVYLTNQVDGAGPNNVLYGTYNPSTYVSLSETQAFPGDGAIHVIITGGVILCSVAGYFLRYIWKNNIVHGVSVFNWNGPPTEHFSCTAKNACTNSPPFIVDANKVLWSNYTCPVAWICHGFCIKGPTGVWNCPGDNPTGAVSAAWCFAHNGTLNQNCTPHP